MDEAPSVPASPEEASRRAAALVQAPAGGPDEALPALDPRAPDLAVATAPDYTAAVYGSLLATTLIAAQWRNQPEVVHIGLSLIISVAVFWLAHSWAGLVNRRIHGPIDRREGLGIMAAEAPMLLAAVVPGALLAAEPLGVLSADTALTLALAASILQLFLWGLAVGRAAHSRWHLALAVASVDALLGLVIVALKIVVIH